jgi:UDP-N-acetylglucosamine 2-epimerase (non-hydrolysing)
MKRFMIVIGTRPELIKLAPLVHELRARPERPTVHVVFTGQHRELVDELAGFLGVEPDLDLDLMRHGQSLNDLAGRALRALDGAITELSPDLVISQGDTTSAAMAALAAYHRGVPCAHVEAGLRSGDLMSPFPEEGNRKIIGQLASHHFAPTEHALANLLAEGVPREDILVTGNTGIDAVLATARRADLPDLLPEAARDAHSLALITLHRRENQGPEVMGPLLDAIASIASVWPEVTFLFPVHPSPRVRKAVLGRLAEVPNVALCEPLGYGEFVAAMCRSRLILSDSGGLQEEAPALDVPLIVLRETTERPEGIEAGAAVLAGVDPQAVMCQANRMLGDERAAAAMRRARNPYGDGRACARIAELLLTGACADPFVFDTRGLSCAS